MPFELKLPKRLKAAGWKLKVREKERVEPPHITVLCHTREWRIGLRDTSFLVPPGGRWKDLDVELVELLRVNWGALRAAWDAKYPENPISSVETEGATDDERES